MNPETIGWAGGIFGAVLGIAGGAVGTYFSIRSTNGPRERAFMVRACICGWLGITALLLLLWALPAPLRLVLFPVFVVIQVLGIRHWNARQATIRQEEARTRMPSDRGSDLAD